MSQHPPVDPINFDRAAQIFVLISKQLTTTTKMSSNLELDTETIRNAADIINSMLLSRAYIEQEIKFTTINWHDLVKDQLDQNQHLGNLEVTETLYNNDKATINIIHSLVAAVDRSRNQHRLSNQAIAQKDSTIAKLTKQVEVLETQLQESETKLSRSINLDHNKLTVKINDLTKLNKLQTHDITKLKNWTNDISVKYHVELKRKNIEIDELKNKLLDKRNLSSTITYGIPLTSPPSREDSSIVNANLMYNNNPIIDNATGYVGDTTNIKNVINTEYQEIIEDLTPIIDSLATENYKFSKFIDLLNDYYTSFNTHFSDFKLKSSNVNFPNPSNIIDLNDISNTNPETIKKYFEEMETFESVAKPVLNNMYRFYHNITNVIQTDTSSLTVDHDNTRIRQLEKELELIRKNWKDALKTAENWKNYQQRKENE